jgi:hypothetical protein
MGGGRELRVVYKEVFEVERTGKQGDMWVEKEQWEGKRGGEQGD